MSTSIKKNGQEKDRLKGGYPKLHFVHHDIVMRQYFIEGVSWNFVLWYRGYKNDIFDNDIIFRVLFIDNDRSLIMDFW